jgi:ABC-type sugar transport system, periplasmic component
MNSLKRLGMALLIAASGGVALLGAQSSAGAAAGKPGASYTMFMRSTYIDWIKELKWYDEAEKRTGIHVEYVRGPEEFADCYSEVDQRIISKNLPDAVMTKLSQTNVYGPQGVFANLAPYIKKYAPNLQAYINANPDYKKLVTSSDGAIYGLCKETPIFADFIGYRADQFAKAGVDPSKIKTVEDFTNALRALKKQFGKDNRNYYPLCGRDSVLRFAAWFGCASSISSKASHGVYVSGHYKDGSFDILGEGAYAMMQTMKQWYDEGLVNPEWVAGTTSEGDWESAMLNGNGSVFYDYYNRAEWFMENGGPKADPAYKMGVLNFLEDGKGNVRKVTTSLKYNDECVTAVNAKCSEATIKTILSFIDYFYGKEGLVLANYGVEGQSFKTAANGTKDFIVDYSTEESRAAGEKKWSFLSDRLTVCKPVDNTAFFKWNAKLISEAAGRLLKDKNLMTSYVLKFNESESKELSNLVAAVYPAETSGMVAFINGTTKLSPQTWASFQEDMKKKGLGRIEAIQLEAYQNTYGK